MSETTIIITKSEGCKDIEFLLQFMDGITVDKLLALSLDDAERLCRLFKANSREGCDADAFTRLDVALCTDANGKHLPSVIRGEVVEDFSGKATVYSEGQYNYLCTYVIPESMSEVRKLLEKKTFAYRCKSASKETLRILESIRHAIDRFSQS